MNDLRNHVRVESFSPGTLIGEDCCKSTIFQLLQGIAKSVPYHDRFLNKQESSSISLVCEDDSDVSFIKEACKIQETLKVVDTGWHSNLLDPNQISRGQTEVTLVKVGQVFTKKNIQAQSVTECLVAILTRSNFLKVIAAIQRRYINKEVNYLK